MEEKKESETSGQSCEKSKPFRTQRSISIIPCPQSQQQGKGTKRRWIVENENVNLFSQTQQQESELTNGLQQEEPSQTNESMQLEPELMKTQTDNSSNLNSIPNQIEQMSTEQTTKQISNAP